MSSFPYKNKYADHQITFYKTRFYFSFFTNLNPLDIKKNFSVYLYKKWDGL